MVYLYLDIETIGAQTDEEKARVAATVKVPGNIKKAESIAAWEKDAKPQAVEEAIEKSSFNGAVGHVCCIGWAVGDEEPQSYSMVDFSADEEEMMLDKFFTALSREYGSFKSPVIVGHYVAGFDIRFITQRAIVLGVRLPSWWPRDPKPWSNEVFDTMTAWAGAKDTISLDNLCAALGLEGKGDIDGSMVGKMFAEGRHDEIAEYCRQDIERVRRVHNKMRVAFGD